MGMYSIAPRMASPRKKLKLVTDEDVSRSSGRPVVFGDTSAGRHLMVVYDEIDTKTVYPITAYDVPRRKHP